MNNITCALLMLLLFLAAPVHAAPRKPLADSEVLQRLPALGSDRERGELRALRAAVSKAPQDSRAATDLAQAYFDLALARGDPRYVGYAEAVVARFTEPLPVSLRVVRGQIRQYRHDFAGALDDFARALADDPDQAAAHAWRAAIFLVQADYAAAEQECTALQQLGRATLAGGCSGLLLAYGGRLDAGFRRLQQALAGSADPAQRLWLLTRLGEVAAWQGDAAKAEAHYRAALRIGRDDTYLLAAWGDFLLDRGRAAEVLTELGAWEQVDGLLLRLAEAQAATGGGEAARLAQMLDDRFAAARLRGDTTHLAEEARYRLRLRGDAAGALRLAAENYRLQREPRDARILLEAAVAAGRAADASAAPAAQPARDWLQRSGFEDAVLRELGRQSATVAPR